LLVKDREKKEGGYACEEKLGGGRVRPEWSRRPRKEVFRGLRGISLTTQRTRLKSSFKPLSDRKKRCSNIKVREERGGMCSGKKKGTRANKVSCILDEMIRRGDFSDRRYSEEKEKEIGGGGCQFGGERERRTGDK